MRTEILESILNKIVRANENVFVMFARLSSVGPLCHALANHGNIKDDCQFGCMCWLDFNYSSRASSDFML